MDDFFVALFALLSLCFLLSVVTVTRSTGPALAQAPASEPAAPGPPMLFGLDGISLASQEAAGIRPDYATTWVGAWVLQYGWKEVDRQVRAADEAGVTPAIHLYYWGDDISQGCLERGCNGKDQAGWQQVTHELVDHLQADLGGKPALVILETEFNKGDLARYEPLDGYLAQKADFLHQAYPPVKVVLGLGDWYSPAWSTWDRAAAASDFVGLQALGGSTRDSLDEQVKAYNTTLEGVRTLKALFGKPVILQDVAFSSYPEPDGLATQEKALDGFLSGLGPLKEAGVEAILYRSFLDAAGMDGYYGEAERHFGLAWGGFDQLKPAGQAWLQGVNAERGTGGAASAAAFTTPAPWR